MTTIQNLGIFVIKIQQCWYLIPLVLLALFFIAYRINRVNLITGYLLSCSVISCALIFCMQAYYSDVFVLRLGLALIMLAVVFLMTFGAYIFIAFLVLNTRAILKRESRSLKHCLTLILAVGILALIIVTRIIDISGFPAYAQYLIYSAYGLIIYYFIHMTQFIISTALCNLSRPRKDKDYIIVLGCQVRDGKATPTLAKRVDKAIEFYERQRKIAEPPKLVLSGGKGFDEECSEAEAMRAHALEKGIPEEKILMEDRAASTMENMKFSREIMDADSAGSKYKAIYATSNYHLLRSGIFAVRAGLKAEGVGARTAFYYLPNALLREYAAYLYINRKWNIAFGAASLVLGSVILYHLAQRFT